VGGLLDGARNFFRGFSPSMLARSQRFSVLCPEGHRLAGLRTEGYQALRCPTCGEGVFVLPRSPLPEPAGASERSAGRLSPSGPVEVNEEPIALTDPVPPPEGWGAGDAAEAGDEIEWLDEPGEAAPPPPAAAPVAPRAWPDPGELAAEEIESERVRASARPAAEAAARPAERSTPAAARPKPRGTVDEAREVPGAPSRPEEALGYRLSQWARAQRNVLIFVGVVVLVVATVAYRLHRARMAELPRVAERGWTEGLAALDEGHFDSARQLLSEARDAVDALGDASEHASDIRQGAREVAILTQLCTDPLESLLDEAARSDARDWAQRFDRFYKGRSIIVDAHVTAVREVQGGSYGLDYRVFRPGEARQPASTGLIDLQGFALVETLKPRKDDRLLFGARLASFRFDQERDVWLIGLEPESGVTMVHRKALEAIDWKLTDDAEDDRP
jgi:hypothetical protein